MEEEQTVKISELESAVSVSDADIIPIVQNGETKKISYEDFTYQINTKLEKNIINAFTDTNYTITTSNTYETYPLTDNDYVGNKLTLSNNGIVIGSGVSKIKVSAKVSFQSLTSGLKWLTIFDANNTVLAANPRTLAARDMIYSTETLLEVQTGDILYMKINGTQGDIIRSGQAYTNIYVEVIE